MENHSVSLWIEELKKGDEEAAQKIWERYYSSLVAVARRVLRNAPKRVADEDDAAQLAFKSFLSGVEQGRFPKLTDRDGLWHLLVTITERKAKNNLRDQRRLKRGGGDVRGESVLGSDDSDLPGIGGVEGFDPTPEFVVTMAESIDALLGMLTEEQSQIARRKLEGFTNREIAAELDCAVSTVERRLQLIRRQWVEHAA